MNRQRGFTLIELALVLVIAGVFLAGVVQPLRASFEQARIRQTQSDFVRIRQVLLGYAASQTQPHLPCPDCRSATCPSAGNQANDGREDRNALGACDAGTALGNLPWESLGLPQGDAWGGRYAYRVAPAYADAATAIRLDSGVADTAQIQTRDGGGSLRSLASNLPVLYLSHGPNQLGGINLDGVSLPAPATGSDEAENLDDDRRYFSSAHRQGAAGEVFDDRVGWIGVYELKAFLIRAGRLP